MSSVRQSLPPDADKWGVSLQLLMGAVVTGGVVVAGCYRWMQENVITDPDCVDAERCAVGIGVQACRKTVFRVLAAIQPFFFFVRTCFCSVSPRWRVHDKLLHATVEQALESLLLWWFVAVDIAAAAPVVVADVAFAGADIFSSCVPPLPMACLAPTSPSTRWPCFVDPFESSAADMKETTSLTLKESAAFLAGNSYLRDVAILVIAYGTSINIVEGGWVGGWVWCFRWLNCRREAAVKGGRDARQQNSPVPLVFSSSPFSFFWLAHNESRVDSCVRILSMLFGSGGFAFLVHIIVSSHRPPASPPA